MRNDVRSKRNVKAHPQYAHQTIVPRQKAKLCRQVARWEMNPTGRLSLILSGIASRRDVTALTLQGDSAFLSKLGYQPRVAGTGRSDQRVVVR